MSNYDSCIFLGNDGTVEWKDVFGKMKPGAHAVAICPVLEHHRITQRVEDAGFEIRDSILFLGEPSFIATLARVPLEGTVAQNVLKHGVGALNIGESRIKTGDNLNGGAYSKGGGRSALTGDDRIGAAAGMFQPGKTSEEEYTSPEGRWPSNIIISDFSEILRKFPDTGISRGGNSLQINSGSGKYNWNAGDKRDSPNKVDPGYGDSGSAARYFYNITEDNKLQGLVAYLHKLITPPGGKVLVYNVPADAIMELRNKSSDIIEFS